MKTSSPAGQARLPASHAALAAALLLVGCGIAGLLVIIKLRLHFDPSFVSSCNLSQTLNCDVVQTSPQSMVLGYPLALFGLASYTALIALTVLASALHRLGDAFLLVLVLSGAALCLHSMYLAYVSTFLIGAYCIYCLALYGVNAALTALFVTALRRKRHVPSDTDGIRERPLALALAAAASGVVFAGALGAAIPAYSALRENYKQSRVRIARAEFEESATELRSYVQVPVTEDDFVLGPSDAPVTVVEFGDFECPFCLSFYEGTQALKERYSGKVRWVFKHFPANSDCNPHAEDDSHLDACNAASAANCAGEQERFWQMHDQLFENQMELEEANLRRYAEAAGVDLAAWDRCYAGQGPDPIIAAHIEQAVLARVAGTPTTYVNGHLVSGFVDTEVFEYYIRAALESPRDPAPEFIGRAPAGAMIESRANGRTFYIDAYEASIDDEGRAQSLPGVLPSRVNWFNAAQACRAASKRLCTAEEWVATCRGTGLPGENGEAMRAEATTLDRAFPYGYFHEAGRCHDDAGRASRGPLPTGSFPRCRTPEGVYDLSGNVAEWTGLERKAAALVASHFASGQNSSCLAAPPQRRRPRHRDATTGFRCCADLPVAELAQRPKG